MTCHLIHNNYVYYRLETLYNILPHNVVYVCMCVNNIICVYVFPFEMVFYIIKMYVYMGFILWVESHDFIHCIRKKSLCL